MTRVVFVCCILFLTGLSVFADDSAPLTFNPTVSLNFATYAGGVADQERLLIDLQSSATLAVVCNQPLFRTSTTLSVRVVQTQQGQALEGRSNTRYAVDGAKDAAKYFASYPLCLDALNTYLSLATQHKLQVNINVEKQTAEFINKDAPTQFSQK